MRQPEWHQKRNEIHWNQRGMKGNDKTAGRCNSLPSLKVTVKGKIVTKHGSDPRPRLIEVEEFRILSGQKMSHKDNRQNHL